MSRLRVAGHSLVLCASVLLAAGCVRDHGVALAELNGLATEASVAGKDLPWLLENQNRMVSIDDTGRRAWFAGPPSRIVLKTDIPRGGVFYASAGIPADKQPKGPVEFSVSVRDKGKDRQVASILVDPSKKILGWTPISADLSAFAGQGREIVLQTKAFESDNDEWRAFWGAPTIAVGAAGRPQKEPLVIVYLVDTLRADHTTPYGYERDTTPALKAFASEAVLFQTAIAHASWTKPSVASLFTSRLPSRHRAVQLRDPLQAGQVTIAEMLALKGFRTGAVVANSVIYADDANFHQGFEVMEGLHGEGDQRSKDVDASVVVDRALAYVDSRRGLPTFLYAHAIDPHVPYQPPPPFDRMFEPHPEEGHWGIDPRTDLKGPKDRERLIAQYDGDIAYGDREFGRFVAGLKSRGVYDDALIVFLSDHGEEFDDHGGWLHGRSVFDELIRVPLIVKFPNGEGAGRRVAQMVQVADVLPTILQSLNLPVPDPPAIIGRPLQLVAFSKTPEVPAISEISHRGFVSSGIRTSKDKYVRRFSPQTDELFFDLQKDPREKENLIAQGGDRVRNLRAAVETTMEAASFRYVIRVTSSSPLALQIETPGWIESLDTAGFSLKDRAEISKEAGDLDVTLTAGPGRTREIIFRVRPAGVPVTLRGTLGGRDLRPTDIAIGERGTAAAKVPALLPEVEGDTVQELFKPPMDSKAPIAVFLQAVSGAQFLNLDRATIERLCALGYLSGAACAAVGR